MVSVEMGIYYWVILHDRWSFWASVLYLYDWLELVQTKLVNIDSSSLTLDVTR